MFMIQPQNGGIHSIRPKHETVLSGIDPNKAQVLALIDIGVVHPEYAGQKVPFIHYCVNESLRLKKTDEGVWIQDLSYGDTLEWSEPFEEGTSQFEGIVPSEQAELVEVESVDQPTAGMWFHIGDEPKWVQSSDHPGSDYFFVGQVESYYNYTTVYTFYHRTRSEVVFICQFS